MTHKEILEKAIQKAIDGGWRGDLLGIVVRTDGAGTVRLENPHTEEEWSVEEIIYNHAFAKALWGRSGTGKANMVFNYPTRWNLSPEDTLKTTTAQLSQWQYHLQQMVISDDPIAYLGEHLD